MIKPGYQRHCQISQQWNTYTFHNFRDFSWTSEWIDQKQDRKNIEINIDELQKIYLVISPFALHNLIGHTMIGFELQNKTRIYLSIEAKINIGKQYSLIHGLLLWYRTRYIWWSAKDILWLRLFRQETIYEYPLQLTKQNIRALFKDFTDETNKIESHPTQYNIFTNNCTSSLRKVARKHFPMTKRHYSLLLDAFLPKHLHSLWVLKLSEKKQITNI